MAMTATVVAEGSAGTHLRSRAMVTGATTLPSWRRTLTWSMTTAQGLWKDTGLPRRARVAAEAAGQQRERMR
jgi:hypothetical protein